MRIYGTSDEYLYDRCQRYRWNFDYALHQRRTQQSGYVSKLRKVQLMTPHKLRLGFAALLASVSLAATAHAQIELNDSNSSGVIVNLRPLSPFYVTQEGALKATSTDAATAKDAEKADDEKADKEKQDKDSADKDADKDKESDKKDDLKDSDNKSPKSDSGRLSPITMESVRAPIGAANISVVDIGTKVLPDDQAAKQMVPRMPLPGGRDRAFEGLTYRWQAANICHMPLYFEEPMLERHGQQCCPTWIQPAVSGSKFLSNLILLPYKATLQPACESRYTLGHFRPGSGAPCLRDTLPWSADAALVQAGATTAVLVGLPW